MCLSRNNQIIDENGYHKSIADAHIGDLVRIPNGTAHITAVSSRPASSIYTGAENGYRVTSWCGSGFPIEGTGNHRVMVAETKPLHVIERRRVKRGEGVRSHVVIWQGMKELSALTLKDKLVYPVRAISNGGAPHLVGRELVSGDNRPQRGGVVSRWMPPVFGREMGFAFGLYLAEGCVSEGRRCVTITLDKDEIDYAKRFGRAIGMNYGKPNPNKGTRTVHYNFYSAALTDWFRSNLGAKDDKHIPEWAWHCGRDFLLGMFEGMILGDGYINPDFRVICFSSTRAHLAVELRDLACALGFGWGSIYRSKGGLRYGRNCQPRYDVVFCNISDNLIRAEFNWKSATCTSLKGRNATASHWAYSTDSRQVYVGIRSISRVPLDDVYDIEIDSPEHEFLLPCAWTHNSEVSRWPDGECYTGDIEPSMNAPDTIAFSESTAWGNEGFFYNLWQESTSGDSDWTAVFLAAYRAKKYSLPIKPSQQPFELTPTEAAFTERVRKEEKWEIQPEFWNWRRKRIKASISRTGFPYAHYESYPITPEEAFQSSGMGAFPRHKLDEQQQKNVKKPEWVGEIVYQGKGAIPKLLLNHMLDKEGNYIDVALEKRELTNRLYVWEQPNPSASYYLGCDVGDGILGSDFTVVEIFRAGYGMEPDTQVAEWVGYEPPIAFAKILYSLGWWYNQSEIAVEYAKEGTATANELAMGLEYPKLYVPRHPDKTGNQLTRYIHWQTTGKTKPYLMTRMNESLLEDSIVIRSQYLLDELRRCVKDASSFAGLGGHDDAAVAACIAHYCMRETMPELRRASRQQTESTFSAPSASRQPAIGTRIFCILDEFYRVS